MEAALFKHLSTQAGVTALVGTRIYPLVLPQNVAYPAIRYQRISTPRVYSKSGPSGDSRPRLQIDCWALTYGDAKRLADAVETAMKGFAGTHNGHRVASVVCDDEQDGYEPDPAPPVYRRTLDFLIWYEE